MNRFHQYFKKYIGLLFVIGIAAAGCTTEGKPKTEENTEKIPLVETAVVVKQKAEYTLKLPGELKPFEEVKIFPKVTGFVQQLYVDRGSRVKKGQRLVRLEAPEITQQYVAASARQREVMERLQYSRQSYNRLKAAAGSSGAVAAIELEAALAKLMSDSAAYLSLKAEMAAAEQLADYLEIRAPFDGVVTERSISRGALVGMQRESLLTLAQQDKLRLTLAIPEKHVRNLTDSTEITYRLSNRPGETFKAVISRSSGVLNQSLRALMVEFDIPNINRQLNGGEYVQAEVSFQSTGMSQWVPTESVVRTPSGDFVLKIDDNVVKKIPVKEGVKKDRRVEVFGTLKENDLVVANASEELKEGTKIRIREN